MRPSRCKHHGFAAQAIVTAKVDKIERFAKAFHAEEECRSVAKRLAPPLSSRQNESLPTSASVERRKLASLVRRFGDDVFYLPESQGHAPGFAGMQRGRPASIRRPNWASHDLTHG